jgi:hypothetical protein
MGGSEPRAGSERGGPGATAPLWPLGLARILYGYLWWQQSAWKVPSDDFGRKSGGGMAANITVSILNVPNEWGWTYTMLIMFPALFLLTDGGRSFGVNAFLAPPLDGAAAQGHRPARIVRWLV